MEQKRPRGRPRGTQINDGRYLDQVADLMLKEPELKKTPAIARVVAKHFPEHQHDKLNRRLLRKWNETHEARIEAAKERREEARQTDRTRIDFSQIGNVAAGVNGVGLAAQLSQMASVLSEQQKVAMQIGKALDSPALQVLRDIQKIHDQIYPPALRQVLEQSEKMQRLLKGCGL